MHAFSLEYSSERNQDTIASNPGDLYDGHNKHQISSPFFPALYPRDYSVEHLLTCSIEACRIHLVFTDFQVATSSTIEFLDSNGEIIVVVSGTSFRPPIILSTGPSMIVRFFANGGTNLGYKATLSFLTVAASKNPSLKPITDCGGPLENIGGAITMMNMLIDDSSSPAKLFDCIWIVKPPSSYMHLKTHLSLRVDQFQRMAGVSSLVIRQGITSDRPVLEEFKTTSLTTSSKSFVVPLVSGFYVSFHGSFQADSRLAIVYTAFSYMSKWLRKLSLNFSNI